MIYIWDNGQDYSDHRIAFVETDANPDDVLAVMAFGERKVIAQAESLAWREGRPATLAEWAEDNFETYTGGLHSWDPDCEATTTGDNADCNCSARPIIDAAVRLGLVKAKF
jgi:hypothetical protein